MYIIHVLSSWCKTQIPIEDNLAASFISVLSSLLFELQTWCGERFKRLFSQQPVPCTIVIAYSHCLRNKPPPLKYASFTWNILAQKPQKILLISKTHGRALSNEESRFTTHWFWHNHPKFMFLLKMFLILFYWTIYCFSNILYDQFFPFTKGQQLIVYSLLLK